MRILVIAATYPPTRCGVGDYVRRLGHELASIGVDVHILTGSATDEEHDHAVDAHAPVGARPEPRVVEAPDFEPVGGGVRLARGVDEWDWSCLDHAAAALDRIRPDVLSLQYHGEDYLLHPAVCALADLAAERGVPLVTTFHNLQSPRGWDHGEDPLAHLLQGSASWITTNTLDERRLREHPVAADRLHLVTAGPCITASVEPVRPATDGPFRLAYFGFLNPFKGIEYLLRAVARLRDEGAELGLTMAAGIHTDAPGRLRDYAAFIDDEIARLELGSLLDRHGYVPDEEVTRLLQECHLAVFPFRDGLSGKNSSFWSTLHHATPALTTAGEGLPRGLVDGENVLLAPIDDSEALAARIRWAMEHRGELERVGRAGRSFVQRDFDWRDLADRTRRIFGATLETSGRTGPAVGRRDG